MDKNSMQTLDQSESKRHLASIQVIRKLSPIKGADRIVLATIEGWKAVVGKDDFKVGDKAVYFEIDSFLPVRDQYSFLGTPHTNHYMQETGYHIKTMKLRGQISQGLLVPISKFDELTGDEPVGTDVTELLGIMKWYVPESIGSFGKRLADFPTQFTEKSDEVRLQSNMQFLDELHDMPYYISVKIDGTSITLVKHEDEVMLASRNMTLDPNNSVLWTELTPVINKLKEMPQSDVVLQGEYYGEGIQKNRLGIRGHKWAIYTVQIAGKRCGLADSIQVAHNLGLDFVPIVEVGNASDTTKAMLTRLGVAKDVFVDTPFDYTLDELLDKSEGKYPNGHNREGIVIRNLYQLREPIQVGMDTKLNLPKFEDYISFKVINNKFLLKTEGD
jgi:RNA ligase (TIGR02306 family)